MNVDILQSIKIPYFILLFFLSFYSIINNFADFNIVLLLLPYISVIFILFFFYFKSNNISKINKFLLPLILFFSVILFSVIISYFENSFFSLIIIILGFYLIYLYLKKISINLILSDYLFLIIFYISILSIISEINFRFFMPDLINSIFNFRFYIFNMIFYLLARLIINDKKDLMKLLYLFAFIFVIIILYTVLEIIILQNSDNILNLEWLYSSLVERKYFPYSFIVYDPFLNAKYVPNGYLYMRHFSGFSNFIIYIFINIILLNLIIKNNNNLFFSTLLILYNFIHPSFFLWSSRTILFAYLSLFFIAFFLLAFSHFKNKIRYLFLFTLFYSILIPITISNFSLFGFSKNYIDDIKLLFAGPILRMADSEELICPFVNKHNLESCEKFFIKNKFIILKLPIELLQKNKNILKLNKKKDDLLYSFGIIFDQNKNKNISTKSNTDYDIYFKNNEYIVKINNNNNPILKYCSFYKRNTHEICNFMTLKNDEFYLNFDELENYDQSTFIKLKLNIAEIYSSPLQVSYLNNLKILNIYPKLNSNFYNCSINRLMYNQNSLDLNCEKNIKSNAIIFNSNSENHLYHSLNNEINEIYNDLDYKIYISSIFHRLPGLLKTDLFENLDREFVNNLFTKTNSNQKQSKETVKQSIEQTIYDFTTDRTEFQLDNGIILLNNKKIIKVSIDENILNEPITDFILEVVSKFYRENTFGYVSIDVKNNLFEYDTHVKTNHKSDIINKENKEVNNSDFKKTNYNFNETVNIHHFLSSLLFPSIKIDNSKIENSNSRSINISDIFIRILKNKPVIFGTESYLNLYAKNLNNNLNLKNLDEYNLSKKIMKTESDMPLINFFHEYGLILLLLSIIFFINSFFMMLKIFYESKNIIIYSFAFFSITVTFVVLVGMMHLNLLFKIEIGYLIFTIIGIVSNIYDKRLKF